MMGWHGGGMGILGWLGMGVFWLMLLGLILWLVVLLIPGSGLKSRATRETPLEILDHRLAGGAIDLATWQEQRAALVGVQRKR